MFAERIYLSIFTALKNMYQAHVVELVDTLP